MRQLPEKIPFILVLLVNIGLYFLAYSLLYPHYGTVDDTEMQMMTSSLSVTPIPDPNTRWSHIFGGYLLCVLYEHFPKLPWYGIYVYGAHFLGTVAWMYAVLVYKPTWFRLLFCVLLWGVLQVPLLDEVQFTSAGGTLGVGGGLLVAVSFLRSDLRRAPLFYGAGFLLLMATVVLRWQVLFMIYLSMAVFLAYVVFVQTNWKKILVRGLFLGLPLVAGWGLQQLHYTIQNKDAGWADFNKRAKLSVTHDILDFHLERYDWTPENWQVWYEKVGWDYNDYQLFSNWFLADSTIFGSEKQALIKEVFKDAPRHSEDRIYKRTKALLYDNPMHDYLRIAFWIFCLSFVLILPKRSIYTTLVLNAIGVAVVIWGLAVFYQLPNRVSFSMLFALVAVGSFWVDRERLQHGYIYGVVCAILLVFSVTTMSAVVKNGITTKQKKEAWQAALERLNPQDSQLFVAAPCRFQEPLVLPFDRSGEPLLERFWGLDFGHLSNVPTYYVLLEYFNIHQNIHTEIIDNPNIFFVHGYRTPFMDWYATFVEQHYGRKIEFEEYFYEESLGGAVWRVVSKKEEIVEEEVVE